MKLHGPTSPAKSTKINPPQKFLCLRYVYSMADMANPNGSMPCTSIAPCTILGDTLYHDDVLYWEIHHVMMMYVDFMVPWVWLKLALEG